MRITSRKAAPGPSSRKERLAPRRKPAAPRPQRALKPASQPLAKPGLALEARVARVKQHAAIEVTVALAGLDRVALELEPHGVFALGAVELRESGTVRLLGKRDGLASLIVRGYAGGRGVIERMVHVQCDGPTVRILRMGYTPPAV